MKHNKPVHPPDAQRARGKRLARKRYSFRLPIDLASRVEALCEMHPQKTRTQLIGDLLDLGLVEAQRVWSGAATGMAGFHPDTRQPVYLLTGPFAEFRGLTYKHHLTLESELGNDDPQVSYPPDDYRLGDVE